MKYRISKTLGALLAVAVVFATSSANAQTTSNGPYYAWPSWDQTLPSSTRFIVLSNMGSNAVLDRETGLVWERSPLAPSPFPLPNGESGVRDWGAAITRCMELTVGNRRGWRLPTIQELSSLIDPSISSGVLLPAGHPFINIQSQYYWSATISPFSLPGDPSIKIVHFFAGDVTTVGSTSEFAVWCVRGGPGVDAR